MALRVVAAVALAGRLASAITLVTMSKYFDQNCTAANLGVIDRVVSGACVAQPETGESWKATCTESALTYAYFDGLECQQSAKLSKAISRDAWNTCFNGGINVKANCSDGSLPAPTAHTISRNVYSTSTCSSAGLQEEEFHKQTCSSKEGGTSEMWYCDGFGNVWQALYTDGNCQDMLKSQISTFGCSEVGANYFVQAECVVLPAGKYVQVQNGYGGNTCNGNPSSTQIFPVGACKKSSEYNGAWTQKSDKVDMIGASATHNQYNSGDCSGTAAASAAFNDGSCTQFPPGVPNYLVVTSMTITDTSAVNGGKHLVLGFGSVVVGLVAWLMK